MIIPNYKVWKVYDVKQLDEQTWRFNIELRTGLGKVYMLGFRYYPEKDRIVPPTYPTKGWRKYLIRIPMDARAYIKKEMRQYVAEYTKDSEMQGVGI